MLTYLEKDTLAHLDFYVGAVDQTCTTPKTWIQEGKRTSVEVRGERARNGVMIHCIHA